VCKGLSWELRTSGRPAERRLERLEPLQLHPQAGVERELVVVEESGVESGGSPDCEVGASAEAPVMREGRRHERQSQALSCEQSS
jgi:hypothetical protein